VNRSLSIIVKDMMKSIIYEIAKTWGNILYNQMDINSKRHFYSSSNHRKLYKIGDFEEDFTLIKQRLIEQIANF